ncbi:SDR family oxidoreductase [Modestobacter sp. Leaf380]|uniref:SDR family oxidoreductase n=1 Tax=Modestobacter sp. Leaf380 TaxID=1736356 RepID=UPI0006F2B402|nr:SDR family NAD(P)-dependent oxidoreductase [Modestobacter sp. Leaf380]KQS71361.1 hypothetical protein ASG41_20090 [Modestobacter sp. Leaf380]
MEPDPVGADLAGRVAVVTGGGNGIGAAVAERLAARGAGVVVVDRDGAAAARVAARVGGTAIRADLATQEGTKVAVARALAVHGRIDLVHLNAGMLSGVHDLAALDVERYRRVVGLNVDAVVFGIQAALPSLVREGGAVLVTASVAGLTPFELDPLYAMTKHAVVGLVLSLAGPLREQGVRIAALCPDFVDTGFIGAHREMVAAGGRALLAVGEVADAAVAALVDGVGGPVTVLLPGRPAHEHTVAEVG